jgi:hypothetical protein
VRSISCATMLALATTAAGAPPNQYLCITEGVGGLHYDAVTRSWKPQGFKPGAKYILRRITSDDVKSWGSLLREFKIDIQKGRSEEVQKYNVGDWFFFDSEAALVSVFSPSALKVW